MSNKTQPSVDVDIAGKKYKMLVTNGAIKEIEEELGTGIMAIRLNMLSTNLTLIQMTKIFTAFIRASDDGKKMPFEGDIEDYIMKDMYIPALTKLNDLFKIWEGRESKLEGNAEKKS